MFIMFENNSHNKVVDMMKFEIVTDSNGFDFLRIKDSIGETFFFQFPTEEHVDLVFKELIEEVSKGVNLIELDECCKYVNPTISFFQL